MSAKPLQEFYLKEGLRQDALINSISTQLATKSGLFMVFAAFVFTAESTLLNPAIGIAMPLWAIVISLLFALAGIVALLWSARLKSFKMPPILPEMIEQAQKFLDFPEIKALSEEEQTRKFESVFLQSLERSIRRNFDVNAKVAKTIDVASWLIGISVSWLFLVFLWRETSAFLRLLCQRLA